MIRKSPLVAGNGGGYFYSIPMRGLFHPKVRRSSAAPKLTHDDDTESVVANDQASGGRKDPPVFLQRRAALPAPHAGCFWAGCASAPRHQRSPARRTGSL
jgi:hypothetical protein